MQADSYRYSLWLVGRRQLIGALPKHEKMTTNRALVCRCTVGHDQVTHSSLDILPLLYRLNDSLRELFDRHVWDEIVLIGRRDVAI